jgi:hypothetical protein
MIAHSSRDAFPAELISSNILARRRKALVIYGSVHFGGGNWLRGRVEAAHPDRFFVVHPYAAHHHPEACAPLLEQARGIWPRAALARPASRARPDAALIDCAAFKPSSTVTVAGEGVLFLAPLESQVNGAVFPDYLLDAPLRREMARRGTIGAMPLVRFPAGYVLRKSDYDFDLDAPGFAERIAAMFAAHDLNRDGQVTAREYRDPLPR